MIWIIVVAALVIIGWVLDREIYFYEGVHLGPRVQAWLYNRWSKKYDEGKRLSQLQDDEMLATPLLGAAQGVPQPFILDFATGTGRLAYVLLSRPEFQGRIIALDLSRGMLEQAAAKLRGMPAVGKVDLLRHSSLPLPFPDAAFDAVCALEVLELFQDMEAPLRELGRVLRPGGILLTSRGTEESGRKAKVKSRKQFVALLARNGFEAVQMTKWWQLFDRVLAVKSGSSPPSGARSLADVMRCPVCRAIRWQQTPAEWKCGSCGKQLSLTDGRILLN